jgi:hypothetical protein
LIIAIGAINYMGPERARYGVRDLDDKMSDASTITEPGDELRENGEAFWAWNRVRKWVAKQ